MSENVIAVLTTIQAPTQSVMALAERISQESAELIVVGDAKGPHDYLLNERVSFISLEDQMKTPYSLAKELPLNHYCRKNIGYLSAIQRGADVIYETDDDNAPEPGWKLRSLSVNALAVEKKGWLNAYSFFSNEHIWPRGFPLDEILVSREDTLPVNGEMPVVKSPVQQGLANNSPDVDAVWRLVLDRPFTFKPGASIYLSSGVWCPFNSQSTWWWPDAFPLMYLPSYCSFRMTDIWRSFITQRCLWEIDCGIVFHAPEVFQDRNLHDLMRDFSEEIPGYKRNKEMVEILESLSLEKGAQNVTSNLKKCYEALVEKEYFPKDELVLLNCWIADLKALK